jgi:hypothetical protein
MDPPAVKQEPKQPLQTDTRLLRWSVALVWLATGVGVLHPLYRSLGSAYLQRLGLPDAVMVATCALEILLGLLVALDRTRTWITVLQVAMVVTFTIILACLEPALLVNPFGILTKNVPLLAVVVTAWLVEREGWSQRALWLLRAGVATVWITEGIFPKILFQQAVELNMVIRCGLVPMPAPTFLILMGVAEAASGVGVLLLHGQPLRWLLGCQIVALVVLPLVAGGLEPSLWIHPFMPLVKNLPILAATISLLQHCRH